MKFIQWPHLLPWRSGSGKNVNLEQKEVFFKPGCMKECLVLSTLCFFLFCCTPSFFLLKCSACLPSRVALRKIVCLLPSCLAVIATTCASEKASANSRIFFAPAKFFQFATIRLLDSVPGFKKMEDHNGCQCTLYMPSCGTSFILTVKHPVLSHKLRKGDIEASKFLQ